MNITLNVHSDNHRLGFATANAIDDHNKQHNTPCCRRTIYCLLEKHAKGINIFGQCKGTGCKEIAQSWELEVGNTCTKLDIKLMLNKKQATNLEKTGLKSIIKRSICENTVTNYASMLADEEVTQEFHPRFYFNSGKDCFHSFHHC